MNRTVRLLIIGALALALSVAVAACGSGSSDSDSGSFDLTIGQLIPLTGELADFGPSMEASGTLALEQINAAIEEDNLDQTVTLKTADSQGDPEGAVQAARQLVAEGTECFAGPAASAETLPVARSVAIREEIPLVSSVATSEEIAELDDEGLINRVMITDRHQGEALVEAMKKYDLKGSAEGKTASIAARNDSYGVGVADYFVEAWEAAGGTIGAKILFDPEQANYNSEAEQMVEGDPDTFVFVGFPKEYVRFGPPLARTGKWSPDQTWGVSLLSENLPEDAGLELTEGLSDAGQGTPDEAPAYQEFRQLYEASGNPPGQAFDAHQFDAVALCYLAAAAAGSTDPEAMTEQLSKVSAPPGMKFTWEELPEALKALEEGKEVDYEGTSGPIDLDEEGDPTRGVFDIFTIKNGKYVPRGEILVDASGLEE